MGILGRIMSATRSGTAAFREAWLGSSGPADADFNNYDARRLRYDLSWAIYAGTVYRDANNRWAAKLRADLGLYTYIRTLFSPATRLVDFHVAHIQGGALDPDAGNGTMVPSALPIMIPKSNTNDVALRRAISQLWQNSNWALAKDTYVRWGGALGDVALEIIDDTERKKVYMDVVDPRLFTAVTFDRFRNVKSYTREEMRDDPERPGKSIAYREEVSRNGVDVVYRTYRDDRPYAWDQDKGEEWAIPYGFIPLYFNQHVNVGLDWGWSEFHSLWSKIREADDVGSVLDDQIRKLLNAPWYLAGVKGADSLALPRTAATPGRPEPGRSDLPMVYGPAGSQPYPMVAPMPIGETSEHLDKLLEEIERDRPILRFDRLRASGDASGTALRVARQPAETAVRHLRSGYDDTTVRAQQGAVAIGGYRGYAGFEEFDLDSYTSGALDHFIGDRPVFGVDALERLEETTAFWTAAETAGRAGMPLVSYLEEQGWAADKIARLKLAIEEQNAAAVDAFQRTLNQA